MTDSITKEQMEASTQAGYRFREVTRSYGDVEQRWLVVCSQGRYEREESHAGQADS